MAESDDFLTGNGIIILILFFLVFGIGGNGFGFGGSNSLTQAELQAGLYNQTTDRNLSDIRTSQCATDSLISTNAMATNNAIAESKYENLIQFKELSNQMCQCCGDMKATIIEENSKTRDLIQANYISGLNSALQDAKNEIAILTSNNNLLGTMGKWYANPYYSGCGCGTSLN